LKIEKHSASITNQNIWNSNKRIENVSINYYRHNSGLQKLWEFCKIDKFLLRKKFHLSRKTVSKSATLQAAKRCR
jgi:hypothetical protein